MKFFYIFTVLGTPSNFFFLNYLFYFQAKKKKKKPKKKIELKSREKKIVTEPSPWQAQQIIEVANPRILQKKKKKSA